MFDRLAGRLSYVQGDFGDDATYERVGEAIKARAHRFSTSRSRRSSSAASSRAFSDAGLTKTGRVVIEKPFGHDGELHTRELADELHMYLQESQIYRIDHFLGKMGIEEILYIRFANTML